MLADVRIIQLLGRILGIELSPPFTKHLGHRFEHAMGSPTREAISPSSTFVEGQRHVPFDVAHVYSLSLRSGLSRRQFR